MSKNLTLHYKSAAKECTKNLCIAGGPGAGKTTVLFCDLLFAICQGLFVIITALFAERASGGIHYHKFFDFTSNETLSPGQLAERAIARLYRSPAKLAVVKCVDVIGLDEMGTVPLELLSALCTVFRYIRGNNRPFGGIRIESTTDHRQPDPVRGTHPLLSPLLCSIFLLRQFHHSVRAALDPVWQQIQEITRLSPSELSDPVIKEEFANFLVHTCTFVRSLDDPRIPRDVLFAFGKKAPIKTEEHRILQDVVTRNNARFLIAEANDQSK